MTANVAFTNELWKIKKWKPIGLFECPECSGELEVFTEAEDDLVFDGDHVICMNCEWVGEIVVDDETWVKEIYNTRRESVELSRWLKKKICSKSPNG